MMNPTLSLFLRLTAVIAIGIVLLFIAGILLKIVIVAAVIAAVLLGGFFLYSLVRRRNRYPMVR
ncbi:MAG TPA: hypothetical protein VMF61_13060 [Candidatus Acidoferrales bacterium]|nr:hypothetical protein [Candidatus Acidoferrales bacterium]